VFRAALISFLLCTLTSCGYRFGNSGIASRCQTLFVPSIKGDREGDLTSVLIEQISRSGCFTYSQTGTTILYVELMDSEDENIGFRYDRHKDGHIRKTIIPTETRLKALADVSLVDSATGNRILGPVRLSASIDFDHDYYTSRNGVNIFSLGQLTDYDEAHDAAWHPLNVILAKKIVDFLCNSW
jgi:hypothetical protein